MNDATQNGTPNLPAVTEPVAPQLPALNPEAFFSMHAQVLIAARMETVEEKFQVFAALDGDTEGLDTALKEELILTGFIVHTFPHLDKVTGEEVERLRAVLICKGRPPIGTCSGKVIASLQKLANLFGRPPWEPGMVVVPVQKTLDGGRRMYRLDCKGFAPKPVNDQAEAQQPPAARRGGR